MEARLAVQLTKQVRAASEHIIGPQLVPPKYTEFKFTLDVNDADYEDTSFAVVVILEVNKGRTWEAIGTVTFQGGALERYGVKNPPWVAGCRTPDELFPGDTKRFEGYSVRARLIPNRPVVIGADFSMT